jgi:acetate kinase
VAVVGSKTERQAARALVAAYHEAQLADLIEHVAEELDRYRAGEVDAYAVDETIHQYHRAAQELWKFCWSGGVGANTEIVARTLEQLTEAGETVDWWERIPSHRPRRR